MTTDDYVYLLLDAGCKNDIKCVTKCYHTLVLQSIHPDSGGSSQDFIALKQAYDYVCTAIKNNRIQPSQDIHISLAINKPHDYNDYITITYNRSNTFCELVETVIEARLTVGRNIIPDMGHNTTGWPGQLIIDLVEID